MLNERTYRTAEEARAFIDGLTEVYDKSILPVGVRQTSAAPDEYVAVFIDEGCEDYSTGMAEIFSSAELASAPLTGEDIIARYLERFPNTERTGADQ